MRGTQALRIRCAQLAGADVGGDVLLVMDSVLAAAGAFGAVEGEVGVAQ